MPELLTKERNLNIAAVTVDREDHTELGGAVLTVNTSLDGIRGLTEEDLERRLVPRLAGPR